MRKHIIVLLTAIFLLAATACSQDSGSGIPGSDEVKIATVEELKSFLEESGFGIARLDLKIDSDDLAGGQFPMTISGVKQLSGSIEISAASGVPADGAQGRETSAPATLFAAANDASLVIRSLTVTIHEEAVDLIESVVSVDRGHLSAADFTVTVIGGGGKTAAGISIGENALAENIDISDSMPGEIIISENCSEYSAILDKIIQANPDMPTVYDAEDAAEFLKLLQDEKRVRLVSDVTVTAADVKSGSQEEGGEAKISLAGGEYSIYLNGFTLESQVVWNLMGTDSSMLKLKVSDGKLDMKNLTEREYSLSEAAVWIYGGSDIEFDNVDYTSEITGIKFVGTQNSMKLAIIDSDFNCDGEYAITTDATNPLSDNVEILISGSSITTDNADDNTAILFNVLGTVTIIDSSVTGNRQALFLRGGGLSSPHRLVNSTFTATGKDSTAENYAEKEWSGGNDAVLAAIVIGNRKDGGDSTYPPGTSAVLDNVIVQTPSHNKNGIPYYGIYIYQEAEGKDVVVSGSISQSSSSQAAALVNANTNNADVDLN